MCGNHPKNKGGMTSVINQIKRNNWKKEGIELTFIPTFYPGNQIIKILYFFISYTKILFTFFFSRPDVVHMHMSYKGSFTRKYLIHKTCKLFGIRDIIHLHGSEFEKWYNSVDNKKKRKIRTLLHECNQFVVLGDEWKRVIKQIEPTTKVTVISNGIEIPHEKVYWNNERCQVLFLGVLIQRKGVSDLINAVSLLNKTNNLNKIHVVIAGTGEEERDLKKLVKDLRLSDYISFAGWVTGNKKKKIMLESQVLVSPSYNEGLPISILEAASYGMPIIATDVGDISAVVMNDRNGRIINPGDIKSLAKSILSINDKLVFERLSAGSIDIIKNKFSIELFYLKLRDLYQRIGVK